MAGVPPSEPLKPFGQATLKELVEESHRLRAQAEDLRKRMADLAKAIDERTSEVLAPHEPPK
jgi:regulator of replication initiation timing